MYMVYWTFTDSGQPTPQSQQFPSDDMAAALAFMESLRARQRAGEAVSFVTMSSEHPDSVGHAGAADPSPDYNWKKRRR